jgi:hypothetical protein
MGNITNRGYFRAGKKTLLAGSAHWVYHCHCAGFLFNLGVLMALVRVSWCFFLLLLHAGCGSSSTQAEKHAKTLYSCTQPLRLLQVVTTTGSAAPCMVQG